MALRTRRRAADGPGPDKEGARLADMSLTEHLSELRRRLVIAVVAVAAGAVVGWLIYNQVLDFMQNPYCEALERHPDFRGANGCNFVITNPLEGITTRLKVSGYVGLVLALPIVLWQLWRFITPGLHPKEKKYAVPFILTSMLLFGSGAFVAMVTFPRALDFLITISGEGVSTFFSPSKYIGLYALVTIAFGFSFQFPVLLVFLQLVGVVTPGRLLGAWRYAIVIIFAVAAVITPSQDPYSLAGMAVPMCAFYFLSIGIAKLLGK